MKYCCPPHNYSHTSPPCHNFKIQQPRCQPLRHGIRSIGKIFDEQIRNSIVAVNDIEYFEAGPDIIKTKERAMAAAFAAVAVEEQCTETNIGTDISGYLEAIAVLGIVGNIVGQVAAIQKIEIHF